MALDDQERIFELEEENKGLKEILERVTGNLPEHPNESRPQNEFGDYCICEYPSDPGYCTGFALAVCRKCGGKIPD